jgi:hypothetical protein
MGREIKRVPTDFDWPLNEVWAGYLNPYHVATECPDCEGSGYSPDAKRLKDQWYGYVEFSPAETGSTPFTIDTPEVRALAERNCQPHHVWYGSGEQAIEREAHRLLLHYNSQWMHHLDQDDVNALWKEGRLVDFNPNWRENKNENVPPPTAEQVNHWSLVGFGHDSINQWICVREKCARLGYVLNCPTCKGEGEVWPSGAAKALYEQWERVEPPLGDGWQIWGTVSEGSPISPVFPDDKQLVKWLIREGYSADAALSFVKAQWSPSMTMMNGVVTKAIECMKDMPHEAPADD